MELLVLLAVLAVILPSVLYFRLRRKFLEVVSQRDHSISRNMKLTQELMYLEEQLTDARSKTTHLQMVMDSLGGAKS